MPADRSKYDVHVGIVCERDSPPPTAPYFYQYEPGLGDRFENAHRISVDWARKPSGEWTSIRVEGLGGLWLQGFARVDSARGEVLRQVAELGILP